MANLILLLIWMLIASSLDENQLRLFIPFIFLMDAAMTSIALAGVTIFYERQEHTLNAILVSPVTENEYLLSKVVTGIQSSLLTVVVIALEMWLAKGMVFNYLALIPAVVIVAAFHTMLGIALTYGAKDFTGIMLRAVLYMFIFLLPAVFGLFDLIREQIMNYLMFLPPESSARLISTSVTAVEGWKIVFGYLYLSILSILIYSYVVRPGFKRRLAHETGV